MDVKFDLVRIGKIRKNFTSEQALKENMNLLKSGIRHSLKEMNCSHKNNRIDMVMIIPGRGYDIKIVLQDIKDFQIRKELRENFPNSIYNGKYSTILDNMNNRIF